MLTGNGNQWVNLNENGFNSRSFEDLFIHLNRKILRLNKKMNLNCLEKIVLI
jgi:hypothetical protein